MPDLAFSEGTLIAGRYRLDALLGEGGMGEVWAATHTVTRRAVALKFLKQSLRNKPGLRQRFLREASTASALKHPNVVEILDVFDFEDHAPVLVMELLEGETLGAKLARENRLSLEETAALLLPVCSAVGTAHALGIVHRDLKPDNIFLSRHGDQSLVKVLDFGIAKLTAEHYLEGGRSALITDTGSMLGTPCYMAPEQATGDGPADHRADVWSIGVILYESLSGTRPIEGENLAQVVSRLVSAGIIPLERIAPELPHDVTALVTQMLARERGRRPQTLAEVSKVLGDYTVFKAPAFGPPSLGTPSLAPPPTTLPRAKVVAMSDADPQGATMLSTPPVGTSVEMKREPARSPVRRFAPFLLVVALGATLWALWPFRETTAERPQATVASASAHPVALGPARAAAADPAPTAREAPSAPTEAKAPSTARRTTALSRAPAKVAQPKKTPPVVSDRSSSPKDESTLFPGRK